MKHSIKYSAALKSSYRYDDIADTICLVDQAGNETGQVLKRPNTMSIASLKDPIPPQPTTRPGPGPGPVPRQTSTISLADKPVRAIRFTVHNTGQLVNSKCSDNHTSAYLLLAGHTDAVQINMRTSPAHIDGVYEMNDRHYQKSNSEIMHFDYQASNPFTAQNVHTLLCREGFNQYTFTGGGIGCRYWNIVMLLRLELQGYMPPGSAIDLHSRLPFQFSTLTRETRPWPIVQGTFDIPQTQARALELWASISQHLRTWINQEKAKSKPDRDGLRKWETQLNAHRITTEQGRVLAEEREQEESEDEESEDEDDGEEENEED